MEIYVDKEGQQFIVSTSAPVLLTPLRLPQNIIEPVNIWLLDRGETAGEPLTAAALDATFVDMVLSARPQADLEEEGLLFSVTDFAAVGAGATLHYQGLLNLNTEALQTAMEGLKTLAVFVDLELINADESRNSRIVALASGLIQRDIYRGTEGVPVAGDPAYPLPSAIATSYYAITGLTGGGGTKLDGIATLSRSAGALAVINVDGEPPLWRLGTIPIATSSAANPTVITTSKAHGLTTGDLCAIGGHSLAGVNTASRAVTVTGAATFTMAVLGGGAGGYVTPPESTALGLVRPDDFSADTGKHWRSLL